MFPAVKSHEGSVADIECTVNAGTKGKFVLPWEARFKIAIGVAEALNYLHNECPRPIIHRDVKSSNILLDDTFKPQVGTAALLLQKKKKDYNLVIKSSNFRILTLLVVYQLSQLSDFGLAIWGPPRASFITDSDVVGTFGYLAPEYFMYGKVSDKVDVYSFGVVLLELLSGREPIGSETSKGQESLVMWVRTFTS